MLKITSKDIRTKEFSLQVAIEPSYRRYFKITESLELIAETLQYLIDPEVEKNYRELMEKELMAQQERQDFLKKLKEEFSNKYTINDIRELHPELFL